jgi:hypothetical protein
MDTGSRRMLCTSGGMATDITEPQFRTQNISGVRARTCGAQHRSTIAFRVKNDPVTNPCRLQRGRERAHEASMLNFASLPERGTFRNHLLLPVPN